MNNPHPHQDLADLAIVNADDFGLSSLDNQTILAALHRGVVSSATLMANMPAFAEACQMVRQHGLQGRIGVHFNLTYGEPLSTAIRDQPEFCDAAGRFDLNLPRHSLRLSPTARAAVLEELQAQWHICEQHGVNPSHIDSHQHVHNLWPIAEVVGQFARRQGVAVRLARNLGHNIGPAKRLYKYLLNRRLNRLSGCTVRYVCTPRDLLNGIRPGGPIEVVAHPILHADGSFGDDYLPLGSCLEDVLDAALAGHQRVAYAALTRPPR